MRILFVIIVFIFGINVFIQELSAQKIASPLEPQAPPKQTELGILFGLGGNYQSGIYHSPECDTCKFEDGNKLGYTLGFVYEQDLTSYLQWGASLRYISQSIESSYLITEDVLLTSAKDENRKEKRPLPFENVAQFNINTLSFQPHLKWSVFPWAFIRLGVGATYISSARFIHTKELLRFSDTLSNGDDGFVEIVGPDPRIKTVSDIDIPNISGFLFSLEPSLGFNFEVSNQIYLSPVFQYSVPLNGLVSDQPDLKIANWRILIELRLAIKLRNTKSL